MVLEVKVLPQRMVLGTLRGSIMYSTYMWWTGEKAKRSAIECMGPYGAHLV